MKPRDSKLLAIFETELREHAERLRALAGPDGWNDAHPTAIEDALRRAHTVKGAARAVGIEAIEMLAHRLETVFLAIREGRTAQDPAPAIEAVLDTAEDVLAAVLAAAPEPDLSATMRLLDRVLGEAESSWQPQPPAPLETDAGPESGHPETVRVSTVSLDDLVRSSSQLLAMRESRVRAVKGAEELYRQIRETAREWQRLRHTSGAGLRRLREAPELRAVKACLDYMDDRMRRLAVQARAAARMQEATLARASRLAGQVHDDACRVLMTPAGTVFDGFRKMVRDLARDENKEVEFITEGMDVQVDRRVLQGLKDAVMHLLRNAVSHGIERPAERVAVGKSRRGLIRLRLEARGGEVEIAVEDDGRGINLERVAEVAVSRGILTAAAAAEVQPELKRLVLEPGFSTVRSATLRAGRGIGLAVAREQVTRLHGEILLQERSGGGVCVVLIAPISISTQHVVTIGLGGWTFGLPARSVERLCRFRADEVETREGRPGLRVADRWVPLARLSALLGLPADGEQTAGGDAPQHSAPSLTAGNYSFAAIAKIGEQRVGLVVDRLVDEREAVIQDLGLPAKWTALTLGAVALEDGAVAVVLNTAALWDRFRAEPAAVELPAAAAHKERAVILVVDDSLTTRALERSILEAHGYRVRLAVDGVQALEQLHEETADLVIADVMMPRMDGMELLRHIKADRALAGIPVIIVSSVEARQEQERGLSLGADAYIVKRKFDHQELLRVVGQLV